MKETKVFICGTSEIIDLITPAITNHEKLDKIITFTPNEIGNQEECENLILKYDSNNNDFLISAYWPWKFSDKIVGRFLNNSINFHPSPLPKDRGWYPHVHQIRNKTLSGVTLHILENELDVGPIWSQKEIQLPFPITAGGAHDLLKEEIVTLFNDNWSLIRENKIKPIKQSGDGNFYSKFELETPEIIEILENSQEESFLRILSSRNINKKSFIKIKDKDGNERYVHIIYSDDGELD